MWIKLAILLVAVLLVAAWVWWELRMDRIAREDEEMWRDATRPADEMGKRRPTKRDL